MNRSTPGLPVHHQLPEFTQTHIHQVNDDAIQPYHPLSSLFPPAPNPSPTSESFPMSQLFAWGGQSTGVSDLASFLPKNSQGWSPLERTGWISLQSKGLSRVFSNTTVQKHLFRSYLLFIILCIFPRWKLRQLSWYCSFSLICAFSAINFSLRLLWLHPIDFVMLSYYFGASLVGQW